MSIASQPDWRLAAGFAASVIVHGAIAVALGGGASLFDLGEPVTAPVIEMESAPVRPGIDRSRAVTINWIGFEDPTPHEARQAETDQPFLTRGPAETPAPETALSQPAPPTPPPSLTEIAEARPVPALPLPPVSLDDLLAQLEQETPPTVTTTPAPPAAQPSTADAAAPAPPIEQAPNPAATPGGGPKEAAPTSRTKPTVIRLGRPIAMQGLEIDTVAPQFSALTRFTSLPTNPSVRVVFNTAGVVVTAEIIHSSGYEHVDRPILDAIYRWTAKGRRLDSLRESDPDQLVELEFRIKLR